jgi:hypothetical protein
MTTTDDDARGDAVSAALAGLGFPATRDEAIARAEATGARDAVVTDLRSLQEREFADLPAVLAALGIGTGGSPDVATTDPVEQVGDPRAGMSLNKATPVRHPAGEPD